MRPSPLTSPRANEGGPASADGNPPADANRSAASRVEPPTGPPDEFSGGRGFGGALLTSALEEAWRSQPTRVWLHTCTLDDAAAMPNYRKRGFVPFKQETYFTAISPEEEREGRWHRTIR